MIELKKIEIEFGDGRFEAKLKPPKKLTATEIILVAVLALIYYGLPLFGAIIGFIGRGYFYASSFSFCFIFFAFMGISRCIVDKKRRVTYSFLVNENGVTQTEVNKTYFLPWSEIIAWGLVNHNAISGHREYVWSERQTCLYFSKKEYTERKAKRFCRFVERNFFGHSNTEERIVFCFSEDDPEESVIEKIKDIICLYSSEEKEQSYIDPDPVRYWEKPRV